MIKKLIAASIAISLSSYALAAEATEKEDLSLYVGQVTTVPAAKISRIAVGNGKLLKTSILKNSILLIGEAAGTGEMHVWFKDGTEKLYHINVSASDTANSYQQLSQILKEIPDVQIKRVNDHNVISGSLTKENLDRVKGISELFPQTINLTKEEDVAMKKMVVLKVQIMEFKTNALKNLGINWSQTIDGPRFGVYGDVYGNKQVKTTGVPAGAYSIGAIGDGTLDQTPIKGIKGMVGISSILTSKINLAVTDGNARSLASPELSTRSGGEAKFLAGGEIPIITSSQLGQTITYKEYGIKLDIKPVADDNGNVIAAVKAEVSAVDPASTVGGYPAFLTRSSETIFNIRDGQTVAISGLVNSNISKNVNGLAGLKDLPILGALFRSKDFISDQTELVFFVTPMILDPNYLNQAADMTNKIDEMNKKVEEVITNK
jgi:pilus assembly protein CpaC